MTPRHIAMFCLAQLGALAGSILLARVYRKLYRQVLASAGGPSKWPQIYEWFADYGWTLIVIPIVCAFVIPRHREDENVPSMGWPAVAASIAGSAILGFAFWVSLEGLIRVFRG
jgi:hypothetical protein